MRPPPCVIASPLAGRPRDHGAAAGEPGRRMSRRPNRLRINPCLGTIGSDGDIWRDADEYQPRFRRFCERTTRCRAIERAASFPSRAESGCEGAVVARPGRVVCPRPRPADFPHRLGCRRGLAVVQRSGETSDGRLVPASCVGGAVGRARRPVRRAIASHVAGARGSAPEYRQAHRRDQQTAVAAGRRRQAVPARKPTPLIPLSAGRPVPRRRPPDAAAPGQKFAILAIK
jgi:hypothetical protein